MNEPPPTFGIDVTDVVKSFSRGPETVLALDGISFSVRPGEVVAMSGPSGSGKSTLLNILLGWQEADSGYVDVATDDRTGSIGVVTQDLALFEDLTAAENTSLASALVANAEPRRLLEQLEIDELGDRMKSQLSLGQQQRVAVARALLSNPTVVIADEPTSHQDAERALLVMDAFRDAANKGAAVLLTSHDPRLIELCDREISIAHGKVAGEDHSATDPADRTSATTVSSRATFGPSELTPFIIALVLAIAGVIAVVALV